MFTNDTAAPDLQSARRKAEAVRTAIYTAVCWANPWGRGRKLSLQPLRGCFCCQAGRGGDPGLPVPPRSPPALLGAFPEDLGLGANGARGCPGPAQLGSCRRLCLPCPDRFASRCSFAPKSTAPPSLKKKSPFIFRPPPEGAAGCRRCRALRERGFGDSRAEVRHGDTLLAPRDPRGAKETPPSALPTPPGPAAALGAPGAAVRAGPAPGP